jgi:uncharacterized membrane-anchored protein
MKTFTMFVAILAMATFVAEASAQTQVPPAQKEEQAVEGKIASVDPSRTEITLTDGTKLVTPQGAVFTPGAVAEGMTIVASYREENGAKVLTGIAVKDRGPATR